MDWNLNSDGSGCGNFDVAANVRCSSIVEVHDVYTFQWHRIVPHSARVRGWTITPSHCLNNQLDTVWRAD